MSFKKVGLCRSSCSGIRLGGGMRRVEVETLVRATNTRRLGIRQVCLVLSIRIGKINS